MKNGKSKLWAIFLVLIFVISIAIVLLICPDNTDTLLSIKSESELEKLYAGNNSNDLTDLEEFGLRILTMPFSFLMNSYNHNISYGMQEKFYNDDFTIGATTNGATVSTESISSSKGYSKTNTQVENVDEADIVKTDGDYIYSLSETSVIITDVRNPKNIKVAAKIESDMKIIPEDLIIVGNKLVVISETTSNNRLYTEYYTQYSGNNTSVKIYNINNKENPTLAKSYTLYEPYYTSRCIGNKLYVISSGYLRKDNNKIITYYTEDVSDKEIGFENIKYLKDVSDKHQTLISSIDLDNISKDVKVGSYLIDIENAYVSENSIYLLNDSYSSRNKNTPTISSLFGLKGVLAIFDELNNSSENDYYGTYTDIYKFNIQTDGIITYSAKAKEKGTTINQYSLDEYNNHLRVALYNSDGTRVVVYDSNLNKIGETSYLAKGEKMYSSRFMGNKAYLVTYRTMDPLYVIDLTNPSKPTTLGELKIPGYSTYLHPYDETHIIGIGMETREVINRNSYGMVSSTFAKVVGMKMALFDVSDVTNPVQISQTLIGDNRTTSSILTNPKALLFSKEKSLIAIPVNNYSTDFSVNTSDSYSELINNYTNNSKSYISEGYLVYDINIIDGFKLKGTITHETVKHTNNYYYSYSSRLLRGLYIDDNLFTVSEDMIKVNDLKTLNLINEMKIKEEK